MGTNRFRILFRPKLKCHTYDIFKIPIHRGDTFDFYEYSIFVSCNPASLKTNPLVKDATSCSVFVFNAILINNMLEKYLKSRLFYIRFVVLVVVFSHIILLTRNYSFFLESIRLDFGFWYAYSQLFDIKNTFNISGGIVALLMIVISSINLSLLWQYIKLRNKVLETSNSFLGIGTLLAMIGTYCISCTAALFGGVVSTSIVSYLPFAGLEIGGIGIMILLYSTYLIAKKLNNPYTC